MFRFKLSYLVLALFVLTGNLLAQSKKDSLEELLGKTTDARTLAQIHNELALEIKAKNLSLALDHIKASLAISEPAGYTKEIGTSYSILGLLISYTDNFDSAIYWNKKAIPVLVGTGDSLEISRNYNRLGTNYLFKNSYQEAAAILLQAITWSNNPKVSANSYNNLGMISKRLGDYANAVEYYAKAIDNLGKLNEPVGKARALNNLGSLYIQKKEYERARACFEESYSLIKDINDPEILGQSLNGLGIIANRLGSKTDALQKFRESAMAFEKAGIIVDYAKQLVNIGDVESELKQYNLAEKSYLDAIKIFEEKHDSFGLSGAYNNLSETYLARKQTKKAAQCLEKAYDYSKGFVDVNYQRLIIKNLSGIYETLGKPDLALKYRKLYEELNEKMINVAENVKYVEVTQALETAKKEKTIQQQEKALVKMANKEKNYLWVLGVLLIAVLIVALLLRIRVKRQRALEENITSVSRQIASLKSENQTLKTALLKTEEELNKLANKYSNIKQPLPKHLVHLSKREYEILLFVAEGLSDKEIAEKVFVSINTVRTHIRRIYDKLLVNSRLEAVKLLQEYQLLNEAA